MDLSPALSLPINVSPSRVRTFYSCPRRHYYEYVLELKQKNTVRTNKFDKGKYFHELAHAYYQLLEATGFEPGSDITLAAMLSRIKNDFVKFPKTAEMLDTFNVVTKVFSKFIKLQSPIIDPGIKVRGVEVNLTVKVNDTFNLHGYGDLFFWLGKEWYIRDHKTGAKSWTAAEARFSNQLIHYALTIFLLYGQIVTAQISYINTNIPKTKQLPLDQQFSVTEVAYSERELRIYLDDICKVVDRMIESDPVPQYDLHCRWCPFQAPCYAQRKGVDPTPIIQEHYVKVDRASKHASFTEEHSTDDNTD